MPDVVDPRVAAIRADRKGGRGSCTTIDECYEDDELVKELDREGVLTADGAVKWAHKSEGLRLEQAMNCRWGEDDDPELKALRDWNQS